MESSKARAGRKVVSGTHKLKNKPYRLGQLIEPCEERNTEGKYTVEDVRGISNNKEIMPTRADITGRSLDYFQIVNPFDFVFNRRTTRMGEKIGLGYNDTKNSFIVTEDYVVFRIKDSDILLPDYLFLFFNRPEFDRYSRWDSWGSATEFFNWDNMCDVSITLPPLTVQRKYVAVYKALKKNLAAYESGLEDLKLTCDGFIENLRKKNKPKKIESYIDSSSNSNFDHKVKYVQGVESSSSFMSTKADMTDVDLSNYTIVKKGDFAYNPSRISLGSIAIYTEEKPCIVSPMYQVFHVVNSEKLIPEYLMMWFTRKEFQRSTLYYAMGSVRDTFNMNLMKEVEIPIPDIEIQQDIVNIYNVYIERQRIAAELRQKIKTLCPLLIKGSLEE
jgi:type I restriction enzyme S subunit